MSGGRFARRQTQAAWVGGSLAKTEQAAEDFKTTPNVDGWVSVVPIQHLCFPPQVFPRGVGAGAGWGCKQCGSFWMSSGCQIIGDYPEAGGNDQAIGPLRWLYVSGEKSENQVAMEMDLYDWRSTVFYNARLLRRLIELNGGTWEDV